MQKNKNIPPLRFPEFSGEWEGKKLGEIADFFKGAGISKEDVCENGKNKCIRYGELYTKYKEIINKINSKTNIEKSFLGKKNDVLIPSSGETAIDIATSSCLRQDNVLLGGDLNVLRLKKDNDGIFLAYDLSNFQKRNIARIAQGNPVVHLYSSSLKSLKISWPLFQEQQKIAEFLRSVDKWIENLRSQKKSFEAYKKGMMQKIFSQKIRFKDDDGKKFLEWEEKKLGDICDYKNGGSFENNLVDNGKYNLINLNSIDITGKLKNNHKTVDYADWYLKKHDLVMVLSDVAHGYFLGLVDVIPENNKYVLNQRMGLLRKKDDNVDLNFLRTYINKQQKYFKLHGQGSSQQNISKGDILKFKVPVPTLLEQQKIAEFLTSISNLIESKQQQITQAEKWKKGLMQGLFM